MRRIITSPRYVAETTGPDPLSLGGGVIRENLKNEIFVTYERAIRS